MCQRRCRYAKDRHSFVLLFVVFCSRSSLSLPCVVVVPSLVNPAHGVYHCVYGTDPSQRGAQLHAWLDIVMCSDCGKCRGLGPPSSLTWVVQSARITHADVLHCDMGEAVGVVVVSSSCDAARVPIVLRGLTKLQNDKPFPNYHTFQKPPASHSTQLACGRNCMNTHDNDPSDGGTGEFNIREESCDDC